MNAGEPPDETGESEAEGSSGDPESGATADDGPGTDSPEDAAADEDGDAVDPAQEVEAAVEEVMGPDALDDGETGDGLGGDDAGDERSGDDAGAATDAEAGSDQSADGEVPTDGETPTDANDGDELDESAAVQAAQELIDGDGAEDRSAGAEAEESADAVDAEDERVGDEQTGSGERGVRDEREVGDERDADTGQHPGGEQSAGGDQESPDAEQAGETAKAGGVEEVAEDIPADVRKYDRFKKIDGGTYDRANEFLRDRTYITAREWAMARLCADFRTETGVEMTKIGENLPELVPFMTDTYTPQAVNQARAAFEEKVRKAGATFLYGAMCDFFTAEELDDVMYEATEVAKFLLEVEGVELSVEEELAAEDHISEVMRDVREHSAALRHDEVTCPECGHEIGGDD